VSEFQYYSKHRGHEVFTRMIGRTVEVAVDDVDEPALFPHFTHRGAVNHAVQRAYRMIDEAHAVEDVVSVIGDKRKTIPWGDGELTRGVTLSTLCGSLVVHPPVIKDGIRRAKGEGLLVGSPEGGYSLTDTGEDRYRQIVRERRAA
jgi:hypothetical protein